MPGTSPQGLGMAMYGPLVGTQTTGSVHLRPALLPSHQPLQHLPLPHQQRPHLASGPLGGFSASSMLEVDHTRPNSEGLGPLWSIPATVPIHEEQRGSRDSAVECRTPPMGLFLLSDRRRLRAVGLVGTSDFTLNHEHPLWHYRLSLRPPGNSLVEPNPLK